MADSGIRASWPGRPSRNPATSTPISSSGTMSLANPQVDWTQAVNSSLTNHDFSRTPRTIRSATVTYHFTAKIAFQMSASSAPGLAKAAKTRIRTMVNI